MLPTAAEGKKLEHLYIQRVFTKEGEHPFNAIQWAIRDAVILDQDGKEKFRQDGVEVPEYWPENTINIVVEKYFRVVGGKKETSARQMFRRVAHWITAQLVQQGLFEGEIDAMSNWNGPAGIYYDELLYMFVNGLFANNSPVWFNVGTDVTGTGYCYDRTAIAGLYPNGTHAFLTPAIEHRPQCSACFIQAVQDTMGDIMDLAKKEVMLFKEGSGTGSNLSSLRSSWEQLSGGGYASGPVSFEEGFDAFAGVTKSGGTTRRAAKMFILDANHPDILAQRNGKTGFIRCKADQEDVAQALFDSGKYTAEWNVPGNVYDLVKFQNANNSIRVTDKFMEAVEADGEWTTHAVKGGKVVHTYKAREVWDEIIKAAHKCGDPGLQFDTTINDWHTCPASGRINASNPCQPAWATVLTQEGIRKFSDIGVGSVIWSGKQWTKVIRKVATGVKPVFRFYTRAGIFAGTEEHRVISNGERIEARFAESIDTAMGPVSGALPYDHQTVVDGLVFGDGSIRVCNDGQDHYPLLYVGENDQSYFSDQNISEYINSTSFDKLCHRVKTTLVREELPKTYLRQIPIRYLGGDEIQVVSFLRGLYSANGSVVGQHITLKAASFTVISQVQEMLASLGIRSYYTTNKENDVEFTNGTYPTKESYDLNISTSRSDFASLIGFIQPYKQEKLQEILSTGPAARGPKTSYGIVAKQLVGEELVWDIEVEAAEHTYWTGGLLVSNCSEYMFLDDTACNLASLNLRKFKDAKGEFDIPKFRQACGIAILGMEALVDSSSYPSAVIAEMSHKFRTLGLGYANLGGLLMEYGLPYDSHEGRAVAAAITSVMGGTAQAMSAKIARVKGPFPEYEANKRGVLRVVGKHLEAATKIPSLMDSKWHALSKAAVEVWKYAEAEGILYGFRNAQVTVLAPTGTIAFLMVCDTTGVEPSIGELAFKKAVGGGIYKIPTPVVEPALYNLGYKKSEVDEILTHIQAVGTIHTCPIFDDKKHGAVFATALGDYALTVEAHVDMMAAVQPFLSGSISKTVNMSKDATVEDVKNIYMRAWRSGLKSIAIYRDGCKLSQPVSMTLDKKDQSAKLAWGEKRDLPKVRDAVVHEFTVAGQKGFFIIGKFTDGKPGELFIEIAKQGSTLNGILDCFAKSVSKGLKYGVPIGKYCDSFIGTRFDPAGFTDNEEIPMAMSIMDYIFRWIRLKFGVAVREQEVKVVFVPAPPSLHLDGPPCGFCGHMTQRAGSCFKCNNCGSTTGCS